MDGERTSTYTPHNQIWLPQFPWAGMSSSTANRRELDSVLTDDVNAELALWRQLAFHTDMASPPDDSNDANSSPPNPSPYFQVPHTAPPQLPPETYNYLIHALLSLQGSASHPLTYPYPAPSGPLPNHSYAWPPNIAPPTSTGPIAGPSSFHLTNPPIPLPHAVPQPTGPSQFTTSPAASSTNASTPQDPDDAIYTAEDKRRRNTAASARFRVKKKLKALNLERTVTDLTGRAEELEREATDLRRENAWLKEIVLLKGRNFATLNLASQAPVPGNQRDEDEKDGRTHAESEPESTAKRREKGKDKES